jgi:type I restriction enzyme S subunit
MQSNYKPIGSFIRLVDVRNKGLSASILLGLSIDKIFIPSVANTVGTDMANYKIIRKGQFACSLMQVRRDKKMPVALLQNFDEAIISQAYPVFEIVDTDELLPEYLMMWLTRTEFDRHACFLAVGGVRGSLEWEDFCNMELPVPSPDKQREIVKEYNVIVNRIKLNEQLNQKLEETAQAIYKQWFVDFEFPISAEYAASIGKPEMEGKPYKSSGGEMVYCEQLEQDVPRGYTIKFLGDSCELITDGKHGDCQNEENSGYYFVSAKDLVNGEIDYANVRQITKKDFEETHKRTNFSLGDILLTNSGTIGRMAIGKGVPETPRTTFQKSVAILKPKKNLSETHFLYCLLKSNIKDLIELAGGTSQSNLLLGDLKKFLVLLPSLTYLKNFEETVAPIFAAQHIRVKKNKKMIYLKNILLSKVATLEDRKEIAA